MLSSEVKLHYSLSIYYISLRTTCQYFLEIFFLFLSYKYSMPKKITFDDFNRYLIEQNRSVSLVSEYISAHTKSIFQCQFGHQFEARPYHIKNGSGCIHCWNSHRGEKRTLPKESFIQWLSVNNKEITLIGKYTNTITKTQFQCVCGHIWMDNPYNIKNGSGCSVCSSCGFNINKPAWEYIFVRDNYLKFGITNDLKTRMYRHRTNGEFVIVHEKYHKLGSSALIWENTIKKTFGGRFVTKEQCPDGFTETLPVHLLSDILEM